MEDLKTIFDNLAVLQGMFYTYNYIKRDENITKKELEGFIEQIKSHIDKITQCENYDKISRFIRITK